MNIELKQKLQNVLKNEIAQGEIPFGSLLVQKDGKELCYLEEGVTRDAIFRMYSMTKPVTSAAIMKLMEQGKIEYTDSVSKYLPGFAGQMAMENGKITPVKREVAIRDLMCMTSGLVYEDDLGPAGENTRMVFDDIIEKLSTKHPVTTIEAANRLGKGILAFQPGTTWNYGSSADVLGAIVEIVSGKRFGEFLQDEFFTPLEMEDTGFFVPENKRNRLVTSFQKTDTHTFIPYTGCRLGINNAMDKNPAFESGGAGLASTIDDYSHFAQMLLQKGNYKGRQILQEKTVDFMTSPKLTARQCETLGWGIGHEGYNYGNLMRIMEDEKKASIAGYNGDYGWDGWLGTYFCNSPAQNMTILFMTQRTDSGWLSVSKKLKNLLYFYDSSK
ncbi:MAG: beta-lactamase family protein [Lachnospiraceae bacterium]|nr:beta-lactamase family protein [Lachnospiraceae bacterium]